MFTRILSRLGPTERLVIVAVLLFALVRLLSSGSSLSPLSIGTSTQQRSSLSKLESSIDCDSTVENCGSASSGGVRKRNTIRSNRPSASAVFIDEEDVVDDDDDQLADDDDDTDEAGVDTAAVAAAAATDAVAGKESTTPITRVNVAPKSVPEPLPPPGSSSAVETSSSSSSLVLDNAGGAASSGSGIPTALLESTRYGRGTEVSVLEVRGTRWVEQHFSITPPDGPRCDISAPAGGGETYKEHMVKLRYSVHDRMNDRAMLEPSLRFVHFLQPLPDQAPPVDWPHLTGADRGAICEDGYKYRATRTEFLPKGGCPNRPETHAPVLAEGTPWCTPWEASVFIGELDCGLTEVCYNGGSMHFAIHSRNGAVMSHKFFKTEYGLNAETIGVRDFETLAVPGYSEYANQPGHFINEVLPRLVHLDTYLPRNIPLVWPSGNIPEGMLAYLRSLGVVSKDREMVLTGCERVMYRAKKLYYFGTTHPTHTAPTCLWFTQASLNARLQIGAGQIPVPAQTTRSLVVLVRSGGARSIPNLEGLLNEVRSRGFSVQQIEPNAANLDATRAALQSATVILAAHGAGLNNIIFARPGAAVIEIGFLRGEFQLPSDYLCLSRNLGLPYWMVLAASGDYGSPLHLDVGKTMEAVSAAFEAATVDRPSSSGSGGLQKAIAPQRCKSLGPDGQMECTPV